MALTPLTVDGLGRAGRPWPEDARQGSRNDDGGPIAGLKLAAAQDGYAHGLEEAGRAGVDIDRLYGVGRAGRTEFHGGAEDHGHHIGERHGVYAGQRLHALRDGVETDSGRRRGGDFPGKRN